MACLAVPSRKKQGINAHLFLADCRHSTTVLARHAEGEEEAIIRMLHGVNELHHTVANQLMAYSRDEEGYPLQGFDQQLTKIANQYGIQGLLTQAVDFARTRNIPPMK
jgi:hypothetical protein